MHGWTDVETGGWTELEEWMKGWTGECMERKMKGQGDGGTGQ